MSNTPLTRKTRFVCISDTHNAFPGGAFKLPEGDVLIHAGDMTNQGTFSELQKTLKWIEEADFEVKIIVAGNHDITLDTDFYTEHGHHFHNQNIQDPVRCRQLIADTPSVIWLQHESMDVRLVSPTGPQTTFKIFGSPFSLAQGRWAFSYEPEDGSRLWDQIPDDCDIVVTHTPPKYHCDQSDSGHHMGCEALRSALERICPILAISGHVHYGRGIERVQWGYGVERWVDPGRNSKKRSFLDLSSNAAHSLPKNDHHGKAPNPNSLPPNSLSTQINGMSLSTNDGLVPFYEPTPSNTACGDISRLSQLRPGRKLQRDEQPLSDQAKGMMRPKVLEKAETSIVNASIMASSWPHRSGGRRFNKPIIIDIDLPIYTEKVK